MVNILVLIVMRITVHNRMNPKKFNSVDALEISSNDTSTAPIATNKHAAVRRTLIIENDCFIYFAF